MFIKDLLINKHVKKHRYLFIIISTIAIGIILYKNCKGKIQKPIPIAYDKQYVSELEKIKENHSYWKKHGFVLKKVDELEDSLAEVYQITGENGIGWNEEPGDFVRINIKLHNGRIVQFDSLGGWSSIFEESDWIPNSPKVRIHPYGVTLDMGKGDQILILIGDIPDIYLTLIYIGKDTAEIIFNKEIISLLAIKETEKGYRLKGQLYFDEYVSLEDRGMATSYPGRQYEIVIENNQLIFHELPKFDMNRLKLPIHFDKKQIESLASRKMPVDSNGEVSTRKAMDGTIDILSATISNYWYDEDRTKRLHANPGDFCKIDFNLPSGVWVGMHNQEGGWVKPSPQIKLPQQSTKVIKHEYGIILDIGGGNYILALTGYKYTQEPSFLTLICVTPDNADMVFNKKLELLEVQETAKGYRLLGKLPVVQEGRLGRLCEIAIEGGELQFKEL
jgi:hypothetical protein